MKRRISILILSLALIFVLPLTVFGADDGKYTAYLHFDNVGSSEGFQNYDYIPQNLSYGTGWNFTKKKLDNFISCKTEFEYDGDKYTFTGDWAYEDGSIVEFPIRVKYTGEDEIHIHVHPIYDVKIVKLLTVERIDTIRDTHASSSNLNEVESFTHTFEDPNKISELPHYDFIGWSDGEEIIQPGESKTWVLDEFTEKYNTITYEALYQPSVTVEWYIEDEKIDDEESFTEVSSDYEIEDELFAGWVTEDGEPAEEVYSAPEVMEEPEVVQLYATFEEPTPEPEPTPIIPDTPDTPTPTPTPTTSEKPTYEPVIPQNNSNTIVYRTEAPVLVANTTEPQTAEPISITTIEDSDAPTVGSFKNIEIAPPTEKWALLNLILALVTLILGIIFLFVRQKQKEDDNEGAYKEDKKDIHKFKLLAIFIGIVSIIVFLFTEDITLEMQLIDKWTIIMLLFFIDQLFATMIIHKVARGSKKDEQWRKQ